MITVKVEWSERDCQRVRSKDVECVDCMECKYNIWAEKSYYGRVQEVKFEEYEWILGAHENIKTFLKIRINKSRKVLVEEYYGVNDVFISSLIVDGKVLIER